MVEPAPIETESTFPTLPARPPTPPRESSSASRRVENKSDFLGLARLFSGDSKLRRASAPATNITPESSAESPGDSSLTSSATARKKVGWSDWPDYKEPPRVSLDGKSILQALQPLPPSSERKPTKSILKAYNGLHEQDYNSLSNGTKLLPPHHHTSFAAMLESIVQQLAGKDRASKLDAYLMLSGSLKASENIPDLDALHIKMGLLLQFIMRDLTEKKDDGKLDNGLAVNAITLLCSFLHKPAITETFTPEFPPAFVDHAIKTFQDPQMSKEIVKHLMFALAQQKFGPKVMTSDRVLKLVTALYEIEIYIKGKSIVMGRINIYRALVRHSKSQMANHTAWIENLFTDMLSKAPEVRSLAIAFGMEASYVLGAESKPSRSAVNLFNIDRGEEGKYVEDYCARLKAMVEKKQDSACVPQVWSVMILFLRCKANRLEISPFLKELLAVIQECFNTSERHTKIEANYAWNRFIFALQPIDKSDRTSIVKLRRDPFVAQLTSRKSTTDRKAALGSVCNLLYYTLKPSATSPELDLYWDEYVVTLIGQCLIPVNVKDKPEQAQRDMAEACLILQCLFDSTTQRPWNENRAMANFQHNSVEAKELPALDSKWLRKSSSRVFPILTQLLERLYWDLGADSRIVTLWQAYITSIGSPAIMEVKVSNDTMACVASIFGFLHKIWNLGPKALTVPAPSNESISADFLRSFEKVVSITIRGLGLLPFTERQLCIGTDTCLPVATPSHRPGKLQGEVRSPFHHLVCLMATVSPGLEYDGRFSQMVRSLLSPFFESRKSGKGRIELAKDLLQYLPSDSTPPGRMLWRVLADIATTATDTREDSSGSNDHPIGVDYRSIVRILETGVTLSPQDPPSGWNTLFEALVTSATIDSGDAGRAIVIIEPLAKFFMSRKPKSGEKPHTEGLLYYHLLLTRATFPKDRQALDAARKRLWGTGNTGPKVSTFDPYIQLYDFIRETLENTYSAFSKRRLHEYVSMISATKDLVIRCPEALVLGLLVKVQEGLSYWILDPSTHLVGDASKELFSIWPSICALVPALVDSYGPSKIMADLEALLCSGLESRHKSIVNQAIRMWNSTFGHSKQTLAYPDRLKRALQSLRPIAELQLPFFHNSLESEQVSGYRQPDDFAESQDPTEFLPTKSMESVMRNHRIPKIGSSPYRKTTPQVIIGLNSSGTRKRSREETPEMGKRKSRKRDSTPRLRHDDSQIQFQAIESSPLPGTVQDSQVLTDRQKEVKERQQLEANMFPDLRSSPKPKERATAHNDGAEPELPLHRSSSRSRTKTPPHPDQAERQTTPTPLPPSEDDNFMVSSPTPKRNSQPYVDSLAPPSSPPDAVIKERPTSPVPEPEVPSSPPEMPEDSDLGLTSSAEYPSAQVDPYALEIDHTFSTFGSTPGQKRNASGSGADIVSEALGHKEFKTPLDEELVGVPVVLHHDDAELPVEVTSHEPPAATEVGESSPVDIETDREDLVSHSETTAESELQLPSTPSRRTQSQDAKPEEPLSSPQFVDALTSPASSDRHTVNEEVFEDAVSSPRLSAAKAPVEDVSSPLSEIDESSILRVMKDYDNGSGRAPVTSPLRQTRASSKNINAPAGSVNASSPGSMRKAALMKATSIQTGQPMVFGEMLSPSEEGPQSSLPSLIPETPAVKPAITSSKIIAEDEEFDPEDTIVVDASSLEGWEDRPRITSKGKRGRRKRKIEETSEEREVPDSQEGQAPAPPQEATRQKKQKRGRKKKSSQVLSSQPSQEAEFQPPQEVDSPVQDWNHSFASTDLDSSMPSVPLEEDIANNPLPDAIGSTKQDFDDASEAELQLPTTHADPEAFPEVEMETAGDQSLEIPASPTAEVVEETTLDNSGVADNISSSLKPVDALVGDTANEIADLAHGARLDSLETPAAVPDEQPVDLAQKGQQQQAQPVLNTATSPELLALLEDPDQIEAATFQDLKTQLSSLMRRFETASLSRSQVKFGEGQLGELEDLLNDTKEQLYGAGRRGRQAGM